MLTHLILNNPLTALVVSATVGAATLALFTFLSRTTERYAAPARAKAEADRTIFDQAAIRADELVDAQLAKIDRDHLNEFLSNFVLQKLGEGKVPPAAPNAGAVAGNLLDEAREALTRRNPDLAGRISVSGRSLQDLLTTAIVRVLR